MACGAFPNHPQEVEHFKCFGGDSIADPLHFFSLSISSFANDKSIDEIIVAKRGGDFAELKSDSILFVTQRVKVEDEAEEHIQKHISPVLLQRNCIVCLGIMKIKVKLLKALF
eukprot:TRINITY_DN8821_c0_g1_i1.p1 TRINITY_DN8821_c0_g1~~TRINITY_DN8821_c0_g1_i1.p1  ORF type:complete len:113 (-),score=18.96 TRINITY_DN8821_c0_g1_i1:292-630(-)